MARRKGISIKKKPLNKPFRLPKGSSKKFGVYVKGSGDNPEKVTFGDPKMPIKKNIPANKKSFLARHNCSAKKDKTTAGYWSCKMWA